jgi:hypothetical protein
MQTNYNNELENILKSFDSDTLFSKVKSGQ